MPAFFSAGKSMQNKEESGRFVPVTQNLIPKRTNYACMPAVLYPALWKRNAQTVPVRKSQAGWLFPEW